MLARRSGGGGSFVCRASHPCKSHIHIHVRAHTHTHTHARTLLHAANLDKHQRTPPRSRRPQAWIATCRRHGHALAYQTCPQTENFMSARAAGRQVRSVHAKTALNNSHVILKRAMRVPKKPQKSSEMAIKEPCQRALLTSACFTDGGCYSTQRPSPRGICERIQAARTCSRQVAE